jgi:hypothetical protein
MGFKLTTHSIEDIAKIYEVEAIQEYRKWINEIPYINFPETWEVKIVPPMGGAIIRFVVKRKGGDDNNQVSVYLDCYDRLGCVGEPYWEIYPVKNDTHRCLMNDVQELLEIIDSGLKNIRYSLKKKI